MISLFVALATVQQAPANPIQAQARAYAECLRGKAVTAPATMTPEAAADDVFKQCDAHRAALEQAVEGVIAAAPPETKAMARQQLKAGIADGRQGLIDGIKSMREAKAK